MITEDEYERRCAESEDVLRPKLTPWVLEVMHEAARIYGNTGDIIATADFVRWCYGVAGVESPDDLDEEINPVGDVMH